MSTDAETPVEIRAPKGARVLEIDFADGETFRLPHRVLRGFCPCAQCQGHQGPVKWVEAVSALSDDALELDAITEVGQYAVQFRWGDGHAIGIYAFRYLRELGSVSDRPDSEIQRARFGR